jgi:LPS export ABC transporter protein LptC
MNKLMKKHWPLAGIALLILVVSFYFFRSLEEITKKPILPGVSLEEGFSLKDIHYTQDNPDEGTRWMLDAKEAKISKDRQVVSFRHFRLKLEPQNSPSIEIQGESGSYDKGSGEISLRENLKGRTDNGYSIVSEHILYQEKEDYIKTGYPVKITGPSFSVEGKGLYVDLKRETLRISANVTTVIDKEALTL